MGVYTYNTLEVNMMTRMIFMFVTALYTSSLFAEEEIYLYTSFNNNADVRVSHKMKCRDSQCMINSNTTNIPISLTTEQRDQILEAFQAEVKRFDINKSPESDKRLLKIKFRYSSDSKRLDITQRLPVDQLSDISPEMTAVLETYYPGFDLSSLGSPGSAASDKASGASAGSQ